MKRKIVLLCLLVGVLVLGLTGQAMALTGDSAYGTVECAGTAAVNHDIGGIASKVVIHEGNTPIYYLSAKLPPGFSWGTGIGAVSGVWYDYNQYVNSSNPPMSVVAANIEAQTPALPTVVAVTYGDLLNATPYFSSNNSVVNFSFNSSNRYVGSEIYFRPSLRVDQGVAIPGDIICTMTSSLWLGEKKVKIGTYQLPSETAVAGINVSMGTPSSFLAGKDYQTVPAITVAESTAGLLQQFHVITLSLPEGAVWREAPARTIAGGVYCYFGYSEKYSRTIEYVIPMASGSTGSITFSEGSVAVSPGFSGTSLTVTVSGDAGASGTFTVGTVTSPVNVQTVTAAPEVSLGKQGQDLPNITISETVAGAVYAGGMNDTYLVLQFPPGVIPNLPSAAVTAGNLSIDSSTVILGSSTSGYQLAVKILNPSTVASTITFSGLKAAIQSNVTLGPIMVQVRGDAVAQTAIRFNNDVVGAVQVATIPGSLEKLVFLSPPTSVGANQTTTLTIQLQDASSNAKLAKNDLAFSLTSTSSGGKFNVSGTEVSTVTIPTGSSSVSFEYVDSAAGGPYKLVAYSSGLSGWTNISVTSTPSTGGSVSGKVLLPMMSDMSLSRVKLTAGSTVFSGTTGTDGSYLIQNITPGTYTLVAENNGYLKQTLSSVTISTGSVSSMSDITLKPGDLNGDGVIDLQDLYIFGQYYSAAA